MNTVVVGDLSGLQSFLFTLTPGEGGQAKRLRARSFFIQILAECCALKFLSALGWSREHLVFCGAAKFVLVDTAGGAVSTEGLRSTATEINRWLLAEVGGQLNFAWAMELGNESESQLWGRAMLTLQRTKLQPWADATQSNGAWQPAKQVFSWVPLDSHNRPQVPAPAIFDDQEIGGRLPRQHWLEIRQDADHSDFNILGYGCALYEEYPANAAESLMLFTLGSAKAPPNQRKPEPRWLARFIPSEDDGEPVTFEDLAHRATGDTLLGVLKMDVDLLGVAFERVQKRGPQAVRDLSLRLDHFFSVALDREKQTDSDERRIYTVFSGGDDLLVVGPWNNAFHYAAHVQARFTKEFARDGLTISAGLALCKPKFPIQRATEYAEELLHQAKHAGRDRFAAFGETWSWADFYAIDDAVNDLIAWSQEKGFERAWLHELQEYAEASSGTGRFNTGACGLSLSEIDERIRARQLAPARLTYQRARKYRHRDFREWVKELEGAEEPSSQTRFLPAIARIALTATRFASR